MHLSHLPLSSLLSVFLSFLTQFFIPLSFFCIFSLSIRESRNKYTSQSYLSSRGGTVFALEPPWGETILQEIRNRGEKMKGGYKRREKKRRGGNVSVRVLVEPITSALAFRFAACQNSGLSHLLSAHSICRERYSSHLITNRCLSVVGHVMHPDIRKRLLKRLLV